MKLLIQTDLVLSCDEQGLDWVKDVCKKYTILHTVNAINAVKPCLQQEVWDVTILAQKVQLNSIDMNSLFCGLLVYTEHEMQYAALGDEGCEFAIEIRSKK